MTTHVNPSKSSKGICVLAYSGGLDTSYCVAYLKNLGYELHTVTVNTGSFSPEEAKDIAETARQLGADKHTFIDETRAFYDRLVRFLIAGNVTRNQLYPLCVSAERSFQASSVGAYAQQVGAAALAHGSTGAGNDQIRFDLAFQAHCPGTEILTPVRDQSLSRQEEIDALKALGVDRDWSRATYSINQGLWGTTIGGAETLTSDLDLPEDAYPQPVTQESSRRVDIEFEAGQPVALDGERFEHPVALIERLNNLAGQFGIGRGIHVGDTIVGLKGRVAFSAPAAYVLQAAHGLLERHVLSDTQLRTKLSLAELYGDLVHRGLFTEACARDIEAFLQNSQTRVTGKVWVTLRPYSAQANGVRSPFDLMQAQGAKYGEENERFSGQDARGFAKILGQPSLLAKQVIMHGSGELG